MTTARSIVRALALAIAPTSALIALSPLTRAASAQALPPSATWEDEKGREAYFWAQRSYPSTERPYAAMWQLRMSMGAHLPVRSSTSATPILGGAWRQLGPTGLFNAEAGFYDSSPQLDAEAAVTAITPSPKAGGPFLIGSASGGVWRTPALGSGWTPLTDDQCALTIGALSVDPVNPSIVYAGTGEYNTNSNGCGILKSVDGGTTWAVTGASAFDFSTGGGVAFGHIFVDPPTAGSTTGTTLLAANNVGLYRSVNSGSSWSLVLSGQAASVVAHPTKAGVRFVGESDYYTPTHRGIYRSSDGGATWNALPPLPQTVVDSIGRIELATSPASPNLLFTVVADFRTSKLQGLYVWDDSLSQWQRLAAAGLYTGINRGDFGAQGNYDLAIAVDPRDARRIYLAGVRAFLSTDGGATFASMGLDIHTDWHSIVIDPLNPDLVYAATDGGIFESTDAGATWASRNAGLAIGQFYPGISISPKGATILGGLQDNSTSSYSGSLVWDGVFATGDGGFTAINYANPTIQWGGGYWSNGPVIIRRDATSLASSRGTGIVTSDRAAFFPPLLRDPVTPTKRYFGTYRFYRTTNEGVLWTPISGDLTRTSSGVITALAVAPSDTLTVYVGTSDGNVQVSRDGGLTFTLMTAGLPNRYVTRIVVDPAAATHALLTVSGFGTGHVFETTTAGVSWQNITGTLVNAPASAVAFIGGTGVIMVGTDAGVFQSADDGVTWQAGPTGIPNAIIQDLVYSPTASLVVAGTYGRGMFAYAVGTQAAVLRGDVNGDAKVDAFDALILQQALVGIVSPATALYPAGDANCNGTIDAGDVLLVLKAAVGLPTTGACVGTVR